MKTSRLSPHTSGVMADLIARYMDAGVPHGSGRTAGDDKAAGAAVHHIFYTGGGKVGSIGHGRRREASHTGHFGARRQVAGVRRPYREPRRRRAAHCLGAVHQRRADLRGTDYVLTTSDVIEPLAGKIAEAVTRFFGSDLQHSDSFRTHHQRPAFDRLTAAARSEEPRHRRTVCGGNTRRDNLYIAPTVLLGVKPDAPVMQEEIFGPILPILEVADAKAAVEFINARPRPLAAYAFTGSKRVRRMFEREVVAERWDSTCRLAI